MPTRQLWASLVAQWQRTCLPVQEPWFRSLCQEAHLEKETATCSSILAWEIPWIEEPGGLQSMVSQRVGHDFITKQQQQQLASCALRFGCRFSLKRTPCCQFCDQEDWQALHWWAAQTLAPLPSEDLGILQTGCCCYGPCVQRGLLPGSCPTPLPGQALVLGTWLLESERIHIKLTNFQSFTI